MAKRKSKQTGHTTIQTQLEKLPLLKKPFDKVGLQVNVPGLFWHCREKSSMCANHAEALKEIELASKNFVDLDGESVAVFNFSESFPHHVKLMWIRAVGLSQVMSKRTEFRDYIRSFQPRASFLTRKPFIRCQRCAACGAGVPPRAMSHVQADEVQPLSHARAACAREDSLHQHAAQSCQDCGCALALIAIACCEEVSYRLLRSPLCRRWR